MFCRCSRRREEMRDHDIRAESRTYGFSYFFLYFHNYNGYKMGITLQR